MGKPRSSVKPVGTNGPKSEIGQESLWPADQVKKADAHRVGAREGRTGPPPASGQRPVDDRRSLQDLLLNEGLVAAKLSVGSPSPGQLQGDLVQRLGQNSMETRVRYAQSVLRWFFADGLNGLARRTWAAYRDEKIEADILRYLYLSAEPIMGACVSDALFPVQEGMIIPPGYLDRFLSGFLTETASAKTKKRLKTNLMRLGFLARARGTPDRLNPLVPAKTSFLIVLHSVFAPAEPRTMEIRHLLAHPFWKYLGYKSEDAVRAVLREADAVGLIGKYVVADQLEQVTTCLTLEEIFERKVRL
jgi:hypothetical protein